MVNNQNTQPEFVTACQFIDRTDLPEVHSDDRRTIYEIIETATDATAHRITRSVHKIEAVTGNHYHDFDQTFRGKGEGILYTASQQDPTVVTEYILPPEGWAFSIPRGMIMALRLQPGVIQIFESNQAYSDGSNTHRVVIAE